MYLFVSSAIRISGVERRSFRIKQNPSARRLAIDTIPQANKIELNNIIYYISSIGTYIRLSQNIKTI